MANGRSMAPPNDKKKHHYVPIAYLSPFVDQRGQLWIYEKDRARAPFRSRPSQIAFENYYYSQPLTGGGQDNNTLEDLFSTIETDWTPLVKLLADRAPIGDRAAALFNFIALLRVRVPAIRDAIELQLAQSVRTTSPPRSRWSPAAAASGDHVRSGGRSDRSPSLIDGDGAAPEGSRGPL